MVKVRLLTLEIQTRYNTPMKKIPKYLELYVIQGHYGQGWEDLTQAYSHKEARADKKAYEDNTRTAVRLITRRELNPLYGVMNAA